MGLFYSVCVPFACGHPRRFALSLSVVFGVSTCSCACANFVFDCVKMDSLEFEPTQGFILSTQEECMFPVGPVTVDLTGGDDAEDSACFDLNPVSLEQDDASPANVLPCLLPHPMMMTL